jgi:Xaa-Pro aminopeptidase
LKPKRIAFDELSIKEYGRLGDILEGVEIESQSEMIWKMRKIKEDNEIKLMKRAAQLADIGMESVKDFIKTGVPEHQVAAEASYTMRKEGAQDYAFPFIVASGPRTAYPHAGITDRKIRKGDLVTVDMGARYQGYCSDLTRTFILGTPSDKQVRIYETVLEANRTAFEKIKDQAEGIEIDKTARDIIEDRQLGDFFVHGLGHGIGLEVHEPPSLSKTSKDILNDRNIVTDEPGIYIPGFGGVRIEDTVLVRSSYPESLTKAPKNIEEIII